jgi:hypothetical protein
MSETNRIAETYIATWNETDPQRRRACLARDWDEAVTYRDPMAMTEGYAALDALMADVHARYPGFRFALSGTPGGYDGVVRLAFSFGPDGVPPPVEGSDVLIVRGGRIAKVIGFLDKVPAQA